MNAIRSLYYLVYDFFREQPLHRSLGFVAILLILSLAIAIKAVQLFIPFTYVAL